MRNFSPSSRSDENLFEPQASVITDSLGNSIHYSYDARGRRITEAIKDPNNTLLCGASLPN